MVQTGNKVAFAFGLTIAAGLATCIGGLAIFSKRLVYLANPKSLAIALGLSCGVMLFISLIEIFGKSRDNFMLSFVDNEEVCGTVCEGNAWLAATVMFLIGCAMVYVLDTIVHYIAPEHDHDLNLEDLQGLRESLADAHEVVEPVKDGVVGTEVVTNYLEHASPAVLEASTLKMDALTQQKLSRTSMLTAVAIALHNLPEGIATFAAAMDNTRFGLALAIGIALHNIPEGIAVAAPVYFATGDRKKAFMWTLISAVAEPVGGVIAWLLIGDQSSFLADGILFGIVAGMMVAICVKELLPTSWNYCPDGNVVGFSVLGGMVIMAASLILFAYAGV